MRIRQLNGFNETTNQIEEIYPVTHKDAIIGLNELPSGVTDTSTGTKYTFGMDAGGIYICTSTIVFTVGGVQYNAEDGMTWNNWIESNYNTNNFKVSQETFTIVNQSGYALKYEKTGSEVWPSDIIQEGNYLLSSVAEPS